MSSPSGVIASPHHRRYIGPHVADPAHVARVDLVGPGSRRRSADRQREQPGAAPRGHRGGMDRVGRSARVATLRGRAGRGVDGHGRRVLPGEPSPGRRRRLDLFRERDVQLRRREPEQVRGDRRVPDRLPRHGLLPRRGRPLGRGARAAGDRSASGARDPRARRRGARLLRLPLRDVDEPRRLLSLLHQSLRGDDPDCARRLPRGTPRRSSDAQGHGVVAPLPGQVACPHDRRDRVRRGHRRDEGDREHGVADGCRRRCRCRRRSEREDALPPHEDPGRARRHGARARAIPRRPSRSSSSPTSSAPTAARSHRSSTTSCRRMPT